MTDPTAPNRIIDLDIEGLAGRLGVDLDSPEDDFGEVPEAADDTSTAEEVDNGDEAGSVGDAGDQGGGEEGAGDGEGEAEGVEGEEEGGEEGQEGATGETAEAKRPPLHPFSVVDAEGNPAALPEGIKIKFKGAGKEREVTPDHLVRLAANGFHNEELHEEVTTLREQIAQFNATAPKVKDAFNELREYAKRLLTDEEFRAEQLEAFEQENTPEARAATERIAAAERERQITLREESIRWRDFSNETLAPIIEPLVEAAQGTITVDEVMGRFQRLIAPLKRDGYLPSSQFAKVEKLVRTDLARWAESQAADRLAKRTASAKATEQSAAAADKRAREEATLRKNAAARRRVPSGTAPGAGAKAGVTSGTTATPRDAEQANTGILGRIEKEIEQLGG